MDQTTGQFVAASRIHIGFAVEDLAKSQAFYRTLLGQEPTKTRPGYAKFEVAEPSLNLSLSQVDAGTGSGHPANHFGIQLKSSAAVRAVEERLSRAGVPMKIEENVTCCYARSDKVWVTDPDGNAWEVYVVLDENGAHLHSSASDCCQDDCCDGEAAMMKESQRSGEAEPVASETQPTTAECSCSSGATCED